VLNIDYFGTQSAAAPYLAPFIQAGPIATNTNYVPWPQLQQVAFFGSGSTSTACIPGQRSNGYSVGLKQTDPATFASFFQNFTDFSRQHPDYVGAFVIERYPTAVTQSVPDQNTAYPHREIKIQL